MVTPQASFRAMGGHMQDLHPSQRDSEVDSLKRDMVNVLQHLNDPKYTFFAKGKEKLNGTEATVVEVNAVGAQTRWWIAPDGKLLQEVFSDVGPDGPETVTLKYSDWKDFSGVMFPTKYSISSGEEQGDTNVTLTAIEVNAAVDPKLFEKPPEQ